MHQYQQELQSCRENNEQHQKDYNFVLIFAEKYTENNTQFNTKKELHQTNENKKQKSYYFLGFLSLLASVFYAIIKFLLFTFNVK